MAALRKPFQGVLNIIRFNWHFYFLSFGMVLLILFLNSFSGNPFEIYGNIFCALIAGTSIISLLVSFYVYDLSGLYKMKWLDGLDITNNSKIVNINAGFDETSIILKNKYPASDLIAFDFYDPIKHTEVSIKRARKAYLPFPDTRQITTSNLPLQDDCTDTIFVILAAHEIREDHERQTFFRELKRVIKAKGNIVVVEHLRDVPNFLAYNIGFFHFIPKTSWHKTFQNAGLAISKKIKVTPFITTFILEKHGAAS